MNNTVSVITIVYNDVDHIENTIKSVINQEFNEVQYIVIDGGSTDGTLEVIHKYSDNIDILISEKDNGIYDAMNKGLFNSNHEWIIFMNSGDQFYSNLVLRSIFGFSEKNLSNYDLIYGDVQLYDSTECYNVISKTNSFKINLNAICHQSVFVRRAIHSKFDLKYNICADHDLIYKLIKNGKVYYVNLIFSKVLIGGISSNLSKTRVEKLLISFRNGGLFDYPLAIVFYLYGFIKECFRRVLFNFFPLDSFRIVRNFKNKIEQL